MLAPERSSRSGRATVVGAWENKVRLVCLIPLTPPVFGSVLVMVESIRTFNDQVWLVARFGNAVGDLIMRYYRPWSVAAESNFYSTIAARHRTPLGGEGVRSEANASVPFVFFASFAAQSTASGQDGRRFNGHKELKANKWRPPGSPQADVTRRAATPSGVDG